MNATNKTSGLVDRFGRIHNYLRISLTERCNLRCFYCMPEEGIPIREKSNFMTVEETLSIAKSFVELGINKIRLTGGEPLIKKGFNELIKELGKLPVELAMTTNAVALDKYIQVLKNAKLNKLNISLDSLNEERMNAISRRSFYSKIMNNIDLAINEGFIVKINVVLIRGVNDDEIIDFIEWGKNKPIALRFIEFMPFDGNQWDESKKVDLDEILTTVYDYYGTSQVLRIDDEKNDTSKNYKIAGAKGSFGIISSVSNPFCDSCNRIRLTADGKLKNCLFSSSESDLLKQLRNGADIKEVIINNILNKKKERGGYSAFNDDMLHTMKNRSMTAIGG